MRISNAQRGIGLAIISVVILAVLSTGVVSGCGGTRSKKIMAFLFDGYPVDSDSTADTSAIAPDDSRRVRELEQQRIKDSILAANLMEMHPPYADGDCTACHNMEGGQRPAPGKSSLLQLAPDETGAAGWLVMPVEQLCIECHSDKSEEYATENNLNIHGPVAEGECTVCHHHHRSRNRMLLLESRVRDLCFQCHEESIPEGVGDHPELDDTDDCTDCHNPHLSAEDFYLN